VHNVFNLFNVKSLYYKNLLLSFYKFRINTVDIIHIYNTLYKSNINLNVPFYHKYVGMKSSFSKAIKLCRLLKVRINIYNFNNVPKCSEVVFKYC